MKGGRGGGRVRVVLLGPTRFDKELGLIRQRLVNETRPHTLFGHILGRVRPS